MVCVCLCVFYFCNRDVRSNPLSALSLGKHAVSVSDHSLAAGARVGVPDPSPPLFNLADSLLTPVVFFFFFNLCVHQLSIHE